MGILKERIKSKNLTLPLFSFMLRNGVCFIPSSWYFQRKQYNNFPKAERHYGGKYFSFLLYWNHRVLLAVTEISGRTPLKLNKTRLSVVILRVRQKSNLKFPTAKVSLLCNKNLRIYWYSNIKIILIVIFTTLLFSTTHY